MPVAPPVPTPGAFGVVDFPTLETDDYENR